MWVLAALVPRTAAIKRQSRREEVSPNWDMNFSQKEKDNDFSATAI
jgi:hypothetical protein